MVEAKIIHITVYDGKNEFVQELSEIIKEVKDKHEKLEGYEFLITNEKIELSDINVLIEKLYELYKKYKALKEECDKNEKKKV